MALTGLQEKTESLAEEHHVPGVAVGIFCDGEDHYACHGVTSVENPLAIEPSTLFQIGSTTKTYTATAIIALAEAGEVELDDPVRGYVPELRLKDEAAARAVTRHAAAQPFGRLERGLLRRHRGRRRRHRQVRPGHGAAGAGQPAGRRRLLQQRGLRAGRPPD